MDKKFEIYSLVDEEGTMVVAFGMEEIGPMGQLDITGEKYFARTPAQLARAIREATVDCELVENIIYKTPHSHPIKIVHYEDGGDRFMWATSLKHSENTEFRDEWSRLSDHKSKER